MPRTFAIIPAAGNSARMGQPKLSMNLAGRSVIEHTLAAWQASNVNRIVVVVQSRASPLVEAVRNFPDPQSRFELVCPDVPPPDMKASIQAALRHIESRFASHLPTAFLVAPADMPGLPPALINLLIERHSSHPDQILVPTLNDRRGHPVLFPWPLAPAVHALGTDEGLSALVQRENALEISAESVAGGQGDPFADVDTPSEFEQLAHQFASDSRGEASP